MLEFRNTGATSPDETLELVTVKTDVKSGITGPSKNVMFDVRYQYDSRCRCMTEKRQWCSHSF